MTFKFELPELAEQLTAALINIGRREVAEQITKVSVLRNTYDPEVDAGYIYVTASRPLNVVEENVIGVRHGESIPLNDLHGIVVIDLDNFGRIRGIELLGYPDVFTKTPPP